MLFGTSAIYFNESLLENVQITILKKTKFCEKIENIQIQSF